MVSMVVLVLLAQQPPKARLTFEHSRGEEAGACPDQAWLEANVSARLGYVPFSSEGPLEARTRFECDHAACTAVLELRTEAGPPRRRLLSLPDCGELAESLALSLALAIDPLRASRPLPQPDAGTAQPASAPRDAGSPSADPPREEAARASAPNTAGAPPPVSVAEPPPRPPGPPPVVPAPAPPSPKPLSGFALVGVHGTAGLSPSVNGGGRVGVGLRFAEMSLALEGRFDLPQSVQVQGGQVTSTAVAGTLSPCLHRRSFGFCLVATVGVLQAIGQLGAGQRDGVLLALLGGRVCWEYSFIPWLSVVAQATLQAPLARIRVVANDAVVWTTWPLTPELGVAAKVRW